MLIVLVENVITLPLLANIQEGALRGMSIIRSAYLVSMISRAAWRATMNSNPYVAVSVVFCFLQKEKNSCLAYKVSNARHSSVSDKVMVEISILIGGCTHRTTRGTSQEGAPQ
jgi:hypothetical protein